MSPSSFLPAPVVLIGGGDDSEFSVPNLQVPVWEGAFRHMVAPPLHAAQNELRLPDFLGEASPEAHFVIGGLKAASAPIGGPVPTRLFLPSALGKQLLVGSESGRTGVSGTVVTFSDQERLLFSGFLGAGNSGDVFEAIYEVAGVGVSTAIKCIKTGFGGETASRVIERLSREKEITSSVSGCPNIISTMGMGYYLGTDEDPFHETASGDLGLRIHPFLLMELGNGTLKIPRPKSPSPIGGFSFEDSIPLMLQMIDAGIALSDAGVVHRDMKPANFVWVGSQIKLADFGLAISKVPRSSGSEVISVTGTHEGTFPYMPPEALGISMESGQSGRSLWNDRSDVFSMGCIFFELLTGRPYVPARKLEGAIQIHMDGKLWQSARRLLRQKSVAPELMDRYKLVCTWIGRMVANDPRDRPTFEQVKVGFRSLVVRSEPV